MKRCKIYVIIPVYNGELYLETAVKSVLRQPYQNIEIVLVDDGSTDESPAICDRLSKGLSRVSTIHQINSGVSRARNAGMEFVFKRLGMDEDAYIGFLDADDFWVDQVLTDELIKEVESNQSDIFGFSCYVCNQEGTRFGINNTYQRHLICEPERGSTDWSLIAGHLCTHFYRASLIQDNSLRFVEGLKYNEDVIFSRESLFSAKSIDTFSQYLHVYRMNEQSVVHQARSMGLDNGTLIAEAWYTQRMWIDRLEFSSEKKKKWETQCRKLAGARLLEAAKILAENGYHTKDIRDAIQSSVAYDEILNLAPEELAVWQVQDLLDFRKDFNAFCRRYRLKGAVTSMLRRLSYISFLRRMRDKRRFPICGR